VSETFVQSSRRGGKTTCRRCNHTVHIVIVQGVEGPVSVETDVELISVILFEARRPQVEHARRLHSERCEDYRRENDRKKIAAERRAWDEKKLTKSTKKVFR
jgi:hypothetical protein